MRIRKKEILIEKNKIWMWNSDSYFSEKKI